MAMAQFKSFVVGLRSCAAVSNKSEAGLKQRSGRAALLRSRRAFFNYNSQS